MSNNVNQQNFSQEDLSGVMSAQSSKRGGRRGGGRRGSTDNFMVGSLGGVTKTNGIGLNYVNEWNDKLKLTSSYFFNQSLTTIRRNCSASISSRHCRACRTCRTASRT